MFDPRLFDVAKARREAELAQAEQRRKIRLSKRHGEQGLKIEQQDLHTYLLEQLGNFLIASGRRLITLSRISNVAVAKMQPAPPCQGCPCEL